MDQQLKAKIRAELFRCAFGGEFPGNLSDQRIYHLIACGLIGEPVPPVMISGAPQKKNS